MKSYSLHKLVALPEIQDWNYPWPFFISNSNFPPEDTPPGLWSVPVEIIELVLTHFVRSLSEGNLTLNDIFQSIKNVSSTSRSFRAFLTPYLKMLQLADPYQTLRLFLEKPISFDPETQLSSLELTVAALSPDQIPSLFLLMSSPNDAAEVELPPLVCVQILNLVYNNIGDTGARRIAAALLKSFITSLNLSTNTFGDLGAGALAAALPNSFLTSLDLGENNIGDDGARKIAEALPKSSLTLLDLCENYIGDVGAADIATALTHKDCSLEVLDLRANNISEPVKQLLRDIVATHCPNLTLRL